MSTDAAIRDSIDRAATSVAAAWPLHSFVTANPLAGFEDDPFHEAVQQAQRLFGGDGYPSAAVFRRAWEAGAIDEDRLRARLRAHGYEADPETLLERLGDDESPTEPDRNPVDEVLVKWLEAYLDEGQAHWSLPERTDGFYAAFCTVAAHDGAIPDAGTLADPPESPTEAIKTALADVPEGEWEDVFEAHLAALPGWTGLIKQRATTDGGWQEAAPITLADYLAARLLLVDAFDAPLVPEPDVTDEDDADGVPLAQLWLEAWEESYRTELVEAVSAQADADAGESGRPDAQLVFCIDTRSEIIRRHVEATGDYETHGYAGFFGVPMRHQRHGDEVTVDACPPILDAQHRIDDEPVDHETAATYEERAGLFEAGRHLLKALKENAATAYNFVESAGSAYGAALAARTLAPSTVYDATAAADETVPDDHEFCEPALDYDETADGTLPRGLTLDQQVEYAATAFELMGIEEFGRLFVFTGHASQTANNPFDSSLDCGACAGNPGGPNARVLATICNDETVRERLRERGIDVPADTVFLAGEHNTTTDDVELFDAEVPESHHADLEQLRADLAEAREGAAAERAESMGADAADPVRDTQRRAADWAETRPEWGLAGNASFVIGPRSLTANLNLDGRAFLHSYDHTTDPEGEALAAIMAGPMVVTQWINNQYYFASVDTAAYGSGSKVTQNPVGNVGVVQGNGGDLLTGLPLQSLTAGTDEPYHQPLRLSTVVHAPVERVESILADNEQLQTLLDNGWLSLTVVDPARDEPVHYEGNLTWDTLATEPAAATAPSVAADD